MELYRAHGLLDEKVLGTKTLLLAGLGSLGSLTLLNLTYPFRRFILIDPDCLSVENVERHALGLSHLGRPKVEGMKDYLIERGINPETIEAFHAPVANVLGGDGPLSAPDLILSNMDTRPARLLVNSYAVAHNVPLLDGGVFAKGRGGQIIVTPRPSEVCYRDAEVVLGADEEEDNASPDYGLNLAEMPEGSQRRIVPALRPSIAVMAAHMARLSLQILSGRAVPAHIVQVFLEQETIALIPPALRGLVGEFCRCQGDLGLLPSLAVRKLITDAWGLSGTGMYQLPLQRAAQCPEHAAPIDIDALP